MQQEMGLTICKSNCHRSMASWFGATAGPEGDPHVGILPHRGGEVAAETLIETWRVLCRISQRLSARWPKTTSPFAIGRPPQRRQRGKLWGFFFGPLFFAWDSGRWMALEKSTRKLLFHPSESESRARMVHWVCGWFVVPEFRNESSQIIHEWKLSSTSFVHGYFAPEIPYNFCGSSTFQYCASRPLSSPLANFCIFGGLCSSARDDWSCCEVECIFVYKNIKETRMCFFFVFFFWRCVGTRCVCVCVLTSLSLVKQSFPFFDVCFSQDVDFHTCYLEIQECFPCFYGQNHAPDPWFHRYPFSSNQRLQPPSPTGWAHRGWRCFAFARAEVPQRRCDAKPPCQGHGWRCRWLGPGRGVKNQVWWFSSCVGF